MRTLPLALFLAFAALPPAVATAAPAATAEEALESAKDAYRALKKDPSRRKFRHHWRNVAARFEKVATRFPRSDRAPEALLAAADLLVELSRISGVEDDQRAAVADYQRLIDSFPKSPRADEATLKLAHFWLDRVGDIEAARRVLASRQSTTQGSAAREVRALLAALPPEKERAKEKRPVRDPKAADESSLRAAFARAREVAETAEAGAPADRRPGSEPAVAEPRRAATVAEASGARTVPSERAAPEPEIEHAAEGDSAGEGSSRVPRLAEVQERLRGVRVGAAREVSPLSSPTVDAKLARDRLRQAAKADAATELSLAAQLGLKVRRVVIDAGHGGHDTGAIGPTGTREKDVTLALARDVARRLEEEGLEVSLTRDDDTFVRLEDRARMANAAKGDLFISIHCNSAASHALRGIETYTLNTSSDHYAIRLAARENASSEKGIGDLQFILADLATKANTEESSRLAKRVQQSLVSTLSPKYKGIRDLGTKEALFYVLLGVRMPAILVETSFVSNPDEEKLLSSETYRRDIAAAITLAVRSFLDDRQKLARLE